MKLAYQIVRELVYFVADFNINLELVDCFQDLTESIMEGRLR